MRKAFGLIQALIVIVLVSGLLVIAMKYAQITISQTADLYVKERAQLFMDEAVEMTLLAISGYNRNTDCLKQINFISEDRRFDANVTIAKYYLYNGEDNDGPWSCGDRNISIQTEDSHGMVELEVVVTAREVARNREGENYRKIRLTRRTLQRP